MMMSILWLTMVEKIKCVGKLVMSLRKNGKTWQILEFYVVDVPGPAIIGLKENENLGLVTIHVDIFHKKIDSQKEGKSKENLPKRVRFAEDEKSKFENKFKTARISKVGDLENWYPSHFNRIGNFSGTASLHLKENAEQYVAAPRKCSIYMRDKIKAELNPMEDLKILRR